MKSGRDITWPFSLLLLAFMMVNSSANATSPGLTSRYVALAIQGDLSGAGELFDEARRNGEMVDKGLHESYRQRFLERSETMEGVDNTFTGSLSSAYLEYWRDALLFPADRPALEQRLDTRLAELVLSDPGAERGVSVLYRDIGEELDGLGLYHFDCRPLAARAAL